eukprot:427390_1
MGNKYSSKPKRPNEPENEQQEYSQIALEYLQKIGFDPEKAAKAVKISNKNLAFAIQYLIDPKPIRAMFRNQINTVNICVSVEDGCSYLHRIANALVYYQELDMNNSIDQIKMVKFCKQYHSLLDDYIHIIMNHNNELENIYTLFVLEYHMNKCALNSCSPLNRHCRIETYDSDDNSNNKILDKQFIFYRDRFDSMHCYFLHLYDMGLRVNKHDIKYQRCDERKNNKDFDLNFANMRAQLKKKQKELTQLENFHFKRFKNNKFALDVDTNDQQAHVKGYLLNNTTTTFMDGLYQYLSNKNVSVQIVNELLQNEEYDSDAIQEDFTMYYSNIKQMMNHKIFQSIQHYMQQFQLSKYSFKIGYRFYYWKYYAKKDETLSGKQPYQNIHDHGGFNIWQLYIPLKYRSLKHEILNNHVFALNIEQFNISFTKALQYIATEKAKCIVAHPNIFYLYYGIAEETPLSINNLLSIIFYTDWSNLSYEFSKTFRSLSYYEPLSSIKCRNREYANWSKTIRETVERFGNQGFREDYHKMWKRSKQMQQRYQFEKGPFFCGLSTLLVIPAFSLRLNSPTSTTKQVAVAIRFGTDDGIVIQLNNNGDVHNGARSLLSWNCNWLSKYEGEDERIWCGGMHTIKLESIQIMENSVNYEDYCKPLFFFDCMVGGTTMHKKWKPENVSADDYLLLSNLINHKLGVYLCSDKYPKYITDTFLALTSNKIQITMNLSTMYEQWGVISDLIMYKISGDKNIADKEMNLFKPIIFRLFNNLKHVVIVSYGAYNDGIYEYQIDILSLLALLDRSATSKEVTVTIRARQKSSMTIIYMGKVVGVNWLWFAWHETSEMVQSKYGGKYEISFSENIETEEREIHNPVTKECQLVITKRVTSYGE